MNTCHLCEKEKELRHSHIFPKSIYKLVRSEEIHHRFIELSTDPKKKNEKIEQSEIKEYLLCGECEQRIGVFEKYAKEALFFRKNVSVEEHEHIDIFKHYEYEKIKLFFLSILWRMSIATNEMFSEVLLGPHEKRIQKMLLSEESIFSWDYPIFAVYPLFDGSKNDGIILGPSFVKNDAHRLYRFVIGGICVFIAMNPEYAKNCPTKPFLMTEEQFPLPKISAEKIMFINNWIAEWQDLR